MRQNPHTPDDMRRNPVQARSQESINLDRAAAVYGNRVFIPVTSRAAPNHDYYNAQEKRR